MKWHWERPISLYWVFFCQYHSTNVPYSFIYLSLMLYNLSMLTETLSNAHTHTHSLSLSHSLTLSKTVIISYCVLVTEVFKMQASRPNIPIIMFHFQSYKRNFKKI